MINTHGFVRSEKMFGSHRMLAERPHHLFPAGIQYLALFPNGYGASIIRCPISYGYYDGKWEIAVINADGEFARETPSAIHPLITGGVDEESVASALDWISALPPYERDDLALPGDKIFLALPEGTE